jgi:prepilin-type processing-associated H-X9-DG protein
MDFTKSWDHPTNSSFVNLSFPHVFLCPADLERAKKQQPGITHFMGASGIGRESLYENCPSTKIGVFGYDREIKKQDIKDGLEFTVLIIESGKDNGPWAAGGNPTIRGLETSQKNYIGKNRQFGGLHSRGVNAFFADGSIRFLSENINEKVFEGIFTIAGEEIISQKDW